MEDRFPTFRRWWKERTLPNLWPAFVTWLAVTVALGSTAWFLRRFAGAWPEAFCFPWVAGVVQAVILANLVLAMCAVWMARKPKSVRQRPLRIVIVLCAVIFAWHLLVMNIQLAQLPWDVGCGVVTDWSPRHFLIQLFMTEYLGVLAVALLFVLVGISILNSARHLRTESRGDSS